MDEPTGVSVTTGTQQTKDDRLDLLESLRLLFHMPRAEQRIVAVGLAICLLVLSGVMYPQTVAHAAHHAHHKAATHSTALCTWMCAAGQAQESVSFHFQVEPEVFHPVDHLNLHSPIEAVFTFLATRGPPSLV